MSLITDVAIIAGSDETAAITRISEWTATLDSCRQQLNEISTDSAGGCKVTSMHIYAAAFNYLDVDGFQDAVRSAPWRSPYSVAVCIDDEVRGTFVMSPAKPGTWTPGPE